jgi:hypothetical protein
VALTTDHLRTAYKLGRKSVAPLIERGLVALLKLQEEKAFAIEQIDHLCERIAELEQENNELRAEFHLAESA